MKLSKQTSDAVQILTHCFRAGDDLVKVASVADSLGLTKQMALKLANVLSQAGFIETTRGPSGGIRLSEEARASTLGDIVRALESQPSTRTGRKDKVTFNRFVDEAFEAFLEVLDRHTIEDMAAKKNTKKVPARKKTSKSAAKALRCSSLRSDIRTAPL